MSDDDIWNAAIEAAAERAWQVCKSDLYVREVGLEKRCAAEIRKLKRSRGPLPALKVRCRCGWQGLATELVGAGDSDKSCPQRGAPFAVFPSSKKEGER